MSFKFFIGLTLAAIVGLAFGQSTVSFTKVVYTFAFENIFTAVPTSSEIMLGGSDLEPVASKNNQLEDFPSNEPNTTVRAKVSEDLSIPEEGKAIVANLESMRLDLYEDGKPIESFEILSKGRPGTAWETPPGSFELLYKKENHFSSIGMVWMPYSMQFFGNYFIHGWPYYPDGTPVAEGYSGGCIRLANSDMETIYHFGDLGTKIIILGSTETSIAFSQKGTYTKKENAVFPKVTAKAYVVADIESGEIIAAHDEHEIYPIASLSKLMTALVSLETINQYREATVSRSAYNTYGSQGNLKLGQKITVGDLIYPLLLTSSNVAAEVLAEFVGRENFIKNMNDKATSIALKDTKFEDPSGLSANNLSTAEELFKLTRYIYKYKKYIFDVTHLKDYSNDQQTWYGNHRFRSDSNFIGGKNGYTDWAKYTLITLLELPLGEFEKRKVAVILLQADRTEEDTRKIISYLLNSVYYTE